MIVKILLTQPTEKVPVNNQKEMNSFIHKSIGHNKYHDSFSDYSISSLQGGKLEDNHTTLAFNSDPYIVVASENSQFLADIMSGMQKGEQEVFGMRFKNFDFSDWKVGSHFDKVVMISPLLLRRDNIYISIRDEGFLEHLNEHTRKKLAHNGITDETFRIELRHPERSNVKKIYVGDVWNICTMVGLTVYGKPSTRKALYNLGLGNSTGSGFGSVKIYD